IHQYTVSVTRLYRVIDSFTINCLGLFHITSVILAGFSSWRTGTQAVSGLLCHPDDVVNAPGCWHDGFDFSAALPGINGHVGHGTGGIQQGGIGREPVNRLALLFAYLVWNVACF